jgi:succinate dehydrogenase / fumarate reductase membrane anchor subunit
MAAPSAPKTNPLQTYPRTVKIPQNYETIAWTWMRYSAIALIPLAWIHVLLQDILVGVHQINLDYVAMRWANMGWRVYDVLLLGFAFAHGMNGFRQVLFDYFHNENLRRIISWVLLLGWLVITLIGAVAIIMGVRQA